LSSNTDICVLQEIHLIFSIFFIEFQGDYCDPDIDNDGILNDDDNCVYISNPTQTDSDGK